MFTSNKKSVLLRPNVTMNGDVINEVKTHKHLDMVINQDLRWSSHIETICIKCKERLDIMKSLKYKIDRKSLEMFYNSFIRPILEYGDALFVGSSQKDLDKLNYIEKGAMRIVSGAISKSNSQLLKIELKWEQLETRRRNHTLVMLYRVMFEESPISLKIGFNLFIKKGEKEQKI